MPPGILVSYNVRLSPVIDFRAGFDRTDWPDLWEDFHCDWRELWFNRHVEPRSWILADQGIAAGAKGILFGSMLVSGGVNLVVYNDTLAGGDMLQVVDPAGVLPKNQESWR